MTEDTVNVDGEEYIFPPDEVVKPKKQETQKNQDSHPVQQTEEKTETETSQSKLEQRKQRISKDEKDSGKILWTGGEIR